MTTFRPQKQPSASFFVGAVIAALFFRFYLISLKPLHHDEGVNSYFSSTSRTAAIRLQARQLSRADSLLFAVLALKLFGRLTSQSGSGRRSWGSNCSYGLVVQARARWIDACCRLASCPVTGARLLLARFHSRNFRLFTLGMVAGGWRYLQTEVQVAILLAISAGLLFATKRRPS
jgi:hypothetical protein